jgi:hypothetical protein
VSLSILSHKLVMNELPEFEFDEPLLDFCDLKQRKVVKNHTHLQTLIRNAGFPEGLWVGPNSHRWTPKSVRDWLATRPTGASPLVQARAAKSAGHAAPGKCRRRS